MLKLLNQSQKITLKALEEIDRYAGETGKTRQEAFAELARTASAGGNLDAAQLAAAASHVTGRTLDAYEALPWGRRLAMQTSPAGPLLALGSRIRKRRAAGNGPTI